MKNMINKFSPILGQLTKTTLEHSQRVAKGCSAVATMIGVDSNLAFKIGYLHDVGKIYIPSRILSKNGKLTATERSVIDLHSYYSYKLVKDLEDDDSLCIPILYHHGYDKPKLEEVSVNITRDTEIMIKLVHSVDIYDAMLYPRVYHSGFSEEKIFDVLHDDGLCTDGILNSIRNYHMAEGAKKAV